MTGSRQRRGRDTERLVAAWFASHGWPTAHATTAGARGADVIGLPFDVEVKARRGLDLPSLLRQLANRATPGRLRVGVVRLDGTGPATLDDWPVVLPLSDFARLATAAGLTTHHERTPS